MMWPLSSTIPENKTTGENHGDGEIGLFSVPMALKTMENQGDGGIVFFIVPIALKKC